MIARADDNAVNGIPGMWGSGGDEMDDVAGRDRDSDAVLYFTHDADPNTVALGDAAAGDAFDGRVDAACGEAPPLDPDKAGPLDSHPSARDCLPFAGYLFDDAAEPYQVRNRAFNPVPGQW